MNEVRPQRCIGALICNSADPDVQAGRVALRKLVYGRTTLRAVSVSTGLVATCFDVRNGVSFCRQHQLPVLSLLIHRRKVHLKAAL
jgi:hypothetical protein